MNKILKTAPFFDKPYSGAIPSGEHLIRYIEKMQKELGYRYTTFNTAVIWKDS